jgi:RNA polymerase sigma-70 factor (ECF subfamily)
MTSIETDILIRCQNGDKEAFRRVVVTHQRMIFSLALKMIADEAEAEDVVQETFIRVWQNFGRYNPQLKFSTWLYSIASRLCIDRMKKMRRIVALPDDELVLQRIASDADSHAVLENKEWVALVRLLADELSTKQKLVFTLCQLEGLSSDEAEQITGLNAWKVKSNLYAARQTIRERLKKLGYE